jgi:hypothetical protein
MVINTIALVMIPDVRRLLLLQLALLLFPDDRKTKTPAKLAAKEPMCTLEMSIRRNRPGEGRARWHVGTIYILKQGVLNLAIWDKLCYLCS